VDDGHVAAGSRSQGVDRLGVVGVVVGQGDSAEAPACLGLRRDELDVALERRAGIDDPRRLVADDPGVRPVERQGARVVRADERYTELLERAQRATNR